MVGAFFAPGQGSDEPLAIDGQPRRGTMEPGPTRGGPWLAGDAVGAGVVLNEGKVALKENEMTAAPKV